MKNLPKYLAVPEDKMRYKGVKSVRSRVVNLRELDKSISVKKVKDALIASFTESLFSSFTSVCTAIAIPLSFKSNSFKRSSHCNFPGLNNP
jgi:lipoate-protein ligase A